MILLELFNSSPKLKVIYDNPLELEIEFDVKGERITFRAEKSVSYNRWTMEFSGRNKTSASYTNHPNETFAGVFKCIEHLLEKRDPPAIRFVCNDNRVTLYQRMVKRYRNFGFPHHSFTPSGVMSQFNVFIFSKTPIKEELSLTEAPNQLVQRVDELLSASRLVNLNIQDDDAAAAFDNLEHLIQSERISFTDAQAYFTKELRRFYEMHHFVMVPIEFFKTLKVVPQVKEMLNKLKTHVLGVIDTMITIGGQLVALTYLDKLVDWSELKAKIEKLKARLEVEFTRGFKGLVKVGMKTKDTPARRTGTASLESHFIELKQVAEFVDPHKFYPGMIDELKKDILTVILAAIKHNATTHEYGGWFPHHIAKVVKFLQEYVKWPELESIKQSVEKMKVEE